MAERLKVRGIVVGTNKGKSQRTGNEYTLVTASVGGEVMTLPLAKEGSLEGVKAMSEQALELELSAFRTEPSIRFVGVAA